MMVYKGIFSFLLSILLVVLSLPKQSSGRPFVPEVIHDISFEHISYALYKKSSDLAIQEFQNNGHYAGYRLDINYIQAKSFAIKLNQDDTVFRSMISANMMIKLEDPLMSCQFLWNYVRIKYKLFLTEKNIFDLWKETLVMLNYIDPNELSYSPEYAIMIRSRPIGSYVANKLPNFPTNDDFLLLISLSSLIYRNGIFAIDLTGENFVLNSEKSLLRENMTPLAYSNVKFYIPILLELYPPSILYSQTFTSVGFVYRMIYYCIGAILTVEDAWHIWANVLLWGGGGYLPRYLRSYDDQILFQHEKDPFPLDRNILIVLERFGAIQKPQWNIRFPPFNATELHPVSKFLNLQGFPIPSKSSKDLSAIISIYQIFHLFLNRFISINMAYNIWFVVKRWVGMTETLDLYNFDKIINKNNLYSNTIFNYKYKSKYNINGSDLESRDFIHFSKWIDESTYIDINSQKVKKLLDDLEKKFPYYITCPNGILVERQEYKSVKSIEMPLTSFYNRKSDRLALSLAKVLHEWIPSISFNDICNIAKTLAVRLPPLGTLNSDFIVRSKAKLWNTPKLKPSEKPYYIQYCVYSLEKLIRQNLQSINLNLTQNFSGDYFEKKCLEAYKTQISCSVSFPFAVTPDVQDIYDIYAGNLASAMASLFHGEVLSLKEVAGTIWDGMLEAFPSRQIPTLIRLHNPWFEPKELCAISEYFLSIGIKYRSTHLIKNKLEKFFYKKREIWSFFHPELPIPPQRIEENMKSKLSIYIPPIDSYNTDVCPKNSEKKKKLDKSENWNLTERQISGMIFRAVNNKVNFMNICVKQMNILFNDNRINCYPKMKSGDYYQIYFNTIRNVRNSFIKKLFKSYSVNKKKYNLAELLSFNGETIHSKASLYMQQFSKYDLLIRFEENIQRLFKWYIYSSCNIAFEVMNRRDINGNLFIYTGVESPKKKVNFEISPVIFPFKNEKVSQKNKALFVDDINQSQMNSINEAVNYGLKYILGDQSATFNFQKAVLLDNNLQFMVKIGWNLELNALDPDFIVKNANFLYYYMISSNIFLSTFQIYKIVSIACDIIACAYQKQYEEIDNFKTGFYIDSLQIKTLTHVKDSLDQDAYQQYIQYWDKLLNNNSQILVLLELVLKERVYKYNVQDIWDNWKAKYIKLKMAKKIVETIKASTFTNLSLIENSMYCLEKLASDFETKPNIAVIGCKSQDLLGYCSNDSLLDGVIELAFAKAIYSFVSESRISNDKALGSGDINSSDIYKSLYKDIKDNNNTLCQIVKKLAILYKLPNFIYNCLTTLMNETSFLQYILNLFLKIPTVDYNMAFHICSNMPLSSKCTSYSDTDSKQEYGEIADIIKGEFMKFQSEYVIHFPPESFCSLASLLASAPTFGSCVDYVTDSISKYKTFYWPENIGYSICLKLKRWPLCCSQEKFPFHSLIVLRFQNLMKIEESKIVEAGLESLDNNGNTLLSNLLEMGQSVQTLAFRVLCTMFEKEHCNHNLYSKSKTFEEDDTKLLLNPHHFCHEIYYPKLTLKDIYSHLRQDLASKITKACMEVLDIILNEINKEKLSIEYTRRNEIPLYWTNKTNNLLPYYMKPLGIVHQLIELFILPPKVTVIVVSLWKEFEEFQNIQDPKDIQEKLYFLIPFGAKLSTIVNSSLKSFISTCEHILSYLLQTSNDSRRETCFKIYSLTVYNDTLVNFIYTMYATNLQAMKIYTSSFTSENPLLTMVEYRSKILRSDTSLRIQTLYQHMLVNYIDYSITKSSNKDILLKKENIKLIKKSKVFTQDYINSNKYIANGLKMFLLLIHLRLSSAFSRKNTYTFQNSIPKHLPNIHNFLPSHLAFQIIDSDSCVNMLHENFIFPSFSEIPDDFEEMENTEKSDSGEKNLSAKSKSFTLLKNNEEKDLKSEEYTENNQINHICKLLRKGISQSELKGYSKILMRMLFQTYLLQISPNYPSKSVETVEIQKSKYTLLEAILFFSKRSPKELTKSFNFHWSESFFKGDEENNIFTHYQTVPEILTWSRMRKFCQIISRQLTHEDFWEENPFLECKYVDSSGNPLASSKPNFSEINKVNVLCYIKPKENIEGDIDAQVTHPITKKIFGFLKYGDKSYGSTENELNLEIPDVLMRVLGRIYGFCILNETPMNLKLPTIFFKKIVGESLNRQQDAVILNNNIAKYIAVLKKAKMSITDMKEKKIVRYGVDKALEYYKIKTPLLFEIPKHRKYSQTEVEPFEIHNIALLEVYIYILQRYYMEEYAEDEIENFLTGIYDIIPKRFFYMFNSEELQEYIQGSRVIEFEPFKEIERIPEYFYAESEEFKLYHKKLIIDYFFNVIKFHISSSQLDIFWSCFTGTTGYGIPGALQGKIRIMEIPQKNEYGDLQEIKIDPNTLTIYLPAYLNLEEMKIYVNKVIEKCDKSNKGTK